MTTELRDRGALSACCKSHHLMSSCPLWSVPVHGLNGEGKAVCVPVNWRLFSCLTNLDFLYTQEKLLILWLSWPFLLVQSQEQSLLALCILYRLELTWCLPCKLELTFLLILVYAKHLPYLSMSVCGVEGFHVFRCKTGFSGESTETQE